MQPGVSYCDSQEAEEDPDPANRPPLLKPRLTSEQLWAQLQPTGSSSGGGSGDGDGISKKGLSHQQLGMSVGHIMAQLRAADAAGGAPAEDAAAANSADSLGAEPSPAAECAAVAPFVRRLGSGGSGDSGSKGGDSDGGRRHRSKRQRHREEESSPERRRRHRSPGSSKRHRAADASDSRSSTHKRSRR